MRCPLRLILATLAISTFSVSLYWLLRIRAGRDVLQDLKIPGSIPWLGGDGPAAWHIDQDDDADVWEARNSDYAILTSIRNARGYYNKVDVSASGYKIMNPTLLELPKSEHIRHDFLVIARTTHVDKEVDGKKYKLARQVAMFANLTFSRNGRPVIQADEEWSRLLVEDFASPAHHCQKQPDMDKYIGPEDMKIFWTAQGEPLLIFTHQIDDEIRCQGQFLIDVRAAVPELDELLKADDVPELPGIRFHEPVGLRRIAPEGQESDGRYQREKNWAPAQSPFSRDSSDLFFMVEPSQLYQFGNLNGVVEQVIEDEDQHSAVEAPYPPHATEEETWRSKQQTCLHDVMLSDAHIHQSTPMLSVTLCNRGACQPTPSNTVLIGMVQRRYDHPTWYDRRIVTYASQPPYQMLSVSKILTYHGESETGTYAWTGSMLYYTHHRHFPPPNHGFLDDEIWLSFGIKDADGGWMDFRAEELVKDHYMCEGAMPSMRLPLSGQKTPQKSKAKTKTENKST
ncbi:hypothetical protein LIA77_10586 [Sarocladium implicatum]|nr:hypothetical protein LIA77_10586 [Sarocladium implicatum]